MAEYSETRKIGMKYHQQIIKAGSIISITNAGNANGAYKILEVGADGTWVKLAKCVYIGAAQFRQPYGGSNIYYDFKNQSVSGHFANYNHESGTAPLSSLDETLENWYNNLTSSAFKNKIVNTTLPAQPGTVATIDESTYAEDEEKLALKVTGYSSNYNNYIYKVASLSTTTQRHVFSLSLQDIIDAVGNETTAANLYDKFVKDFVLGSNGILLYDAADYGHFNPSDNGLALGIETTVQPTNKSVVKSMYVGDVYPVFRFSLYTWDDWETIRL